MTVAVETPVSRFAGNDVTTAFATGFTFDAAGDLLVELWTAGVAAPQTITTHYTVSGGVGAAGTVTMLTAPPSGTTLTISRATDALQDSDLDAGAAIPVGDVEATLDAMARRIQELELAVSEALVQPRVEVPSALALPAAAARAGGILGFNADGTALAIGADLATVVDDTATLVPIASDLTALAAIVGDIQAVEDIASDVTTLAPVASDVTTLAGLMPTGASVINASAGIHATVKTWAELRALPVADLRDGAAILLLGDLAPGDGYRAGVFVVRVGNCASQVAADELNAGEGDGPIWVAPSADKTGGTVALQRVVPKGHERRVHFAWCGAPGATPAALLTKLLATGAANGKRTLVMPAQTTLAMEAGITIDPEYWAYEADECTLDFSAVVSGDLVTVGGATQIGSEFRGMDIFHTGDVTGSSNQWESGQRRYSGATVNGLVLGGAGIYSHFNQFEDLDIRGCYRGVDVRQNGYGTQIFRPEIVQCGISIDHTGLSNAGENMTVFGGFIGNCDVLIRIAHWSAHYHFDNVSLDNIGCWVIGLDAAQCIFEGCNIENPNGDGLANGLVVDGKTCTGLAYVEHEGFSLMFDKCQLILGATGADYLLYDDRTSDQGPRPIIMRDPFMIENINTNTGYLTGSAGAPIKWEGTMWAGQGAPRGKPLGAPCNEFPWEAVAAGTLPYGLVIGRDNGAPSHTDPWTTTNLSLVVDSVEQYLGADTVRLDGSTGAFVQKQIYIFFLPSAKLAAPWGEVVLKTDGVNTITARFGRVRGRPSGAGGWVPDHASFRQAGDAFNLTNASDWVKAVFADGNRKVNMHEMFCCQINADGLAALGGFKLWIGRIWGGYS